jgi:hypothetical protein
MISAVINALTKELKYLVKDNEGMVILDTNIKNDASFSLPLVVLECDDAPESAALMGGLVRMDWSFRMRIYTQGPDAYADDETELSTSHLDFMDVIKNHFIKGVWKTKLMYDLVTSYEFRMTYTGTYKAQDLDTEDRTIKGVVHNFETIGFDKSIQPLEYMTIESETANGIVLGENGQNLDTNVDYIYSNDEIIVA